MSLLRRRGIAAASGGGSPDPTWDDPQVASHNADLRLVLSGYEELAASHNADIVIVEPV